MEAVLNLVGMLVGMVVLLVAVVLLGLLATQAVKWSSVLAAKAEQKKREYRANVPRGVQESVNAGLVQLRTQVDETTDPAIVYVAKVLESVLMLAHLSPKYADADTVRTFALQLIDKLIEDTSPAVAIPVE